MPALDCQCWINTHMRAIDRLKKACSMKSQRKAVELPDGSELEYFMTPLTIAERKKAQKAAKDDDPTEFALQLLVQKAKDENGGQLFTIADLPEMRLALPASVVEALMLQLLADEESEEEAEELDMKSASKAAA